MGCDHVHRLSKAFGIASAFATCLGMASACSTPATDAETQVDVTNTSPALSSPTTPKSADTSVQPEAGLPDGYYRFGKTTPEISTSRHRPPITVTVASPKKFTPVEPAENPLAVNLYFVVTVANLSDEEAWDSPTILTEACTDRELSRSSPCESPGELIYKDGRWTDYPDELPPGESMTFRVEYSLASADHVTLDLDIDGLAGPTIHFVTRAVSLD